MPSVTRKKHTPRAARREEIVAQVLKAVEELLDQGEGYTELSVERIITAANISRSTFYVYFEDKGDLILALTEDVVRRLVDAARAWWELPPDASRDDLETALRGVIDVYRPHQLLWNAVTDASAYDARVRERFVEVVGVAAAGVAKHIKDGQAAGYVRPELDPQRTGQWLTWMTERGLYTLVAGTGEAEVKRLCAAQATIVWNTLYEGMKTQQGRRTKTR